MDQTIIYLSDEDEYKDEYGIMNDNDNQNKIPKSNIDQNITWNDNNIDDINNNTNKNGFKYTQTGLKRNIHGDCKEEDKRNIKCVYTRIINQLSKQ